jgi:hypothetical protein
VGQVLHVMFSATQSYKISTQLGMPMTSNKLRGLKIKEQLLKRIERCRVRYSKVASN